jgi:hypothetical protein
MQYTIIINQKAILDNGLDLNLKEATILDVLMRMVHSWAELIKIQENGKEYYWFSYNHVLSQAPILDIKADSLYRAMSDLAARGYLEPYPNNKMLKKAFYAIGSKCSLLISEKIPSTRKETHTTTEKTPLYNSNTLDNKINNKAENKNTPLPKDLNFEKENFAPKEKVFASHHIPIGVQELLQNFDNSELATSAWLEWLQYKYDQYGFEFHKQTLHSKSFCEATKEMQYKAADFAEAVSSSISRTYKTIIFNAPNNFKNGKSDNQKFTDQLNGIGTILPSF